MCFWCVLNYLLKFVKNCIRNWRICWNQFEFEFWWNAFTSISIIFMNKTKDEKFSERLSEDDIREVHLLNKSETRVHSTDQITTQWPHRLYLNINRISICFSENKWKIVWFSCLSCLCIIFSTKWWINWQ